MPSSQAMTITDDDDIEVMKESFLSHLETTGIVKMALANSGLPLKIAYRQKKTDKDFRQAWDIAVDSSMDLLEGEAYRRAFEGVSEPVFRKHGQVGTVTKYSDQLLMFLLKGHYPEKYREKFDIKKTIDVTIKAAELPDDMLAKIAAGDDMLAKIMAGDVIEGEIVNGED